MTEKQLMNDQPASGFTLSPTKQALLKIRELKQQLAEARTQRGDDIAIVSMACRFPRRSSTPEIFWQQLLQGTNQVSEIPGDRWDLDAYFDENPDAPGKMYARHGAFLDDIDQAYRYYHNFRGMRPQSSKLRLF